MENLSVTWLTDYWIDFEYKKYTLLAYLKNVQGEFDDMKLYPHYHHLIDHHNTLKSYKEQKTHLKADFSRKLIGIDMGNIELKYEEISEDSNELVTIDRIIDYADPVIHKKIMRGKFIYDEVEKCTDIYELGVGGINYDFGYFIITHGDEILVYEYEVSLMNTHGKRTIHTDLIKVYPNGLITSLLSIKLDLINTSEYSTYPVFVVDNPIEYPLEETLLPVVKKMITELIYPHRIF